MLEAAYTEDRLKYLPGIGSGCLFEIMRELGRNRKKHPDGWYYEGSHDKVNWIQASPLIPLHIMPTEDPLCQIRYQFPYIKVIQWCNGEKQEVFIGNDVYWAFKHGHVCPTCHQFVFGPVEPKEEGGE